MDEFSTTFMQDFAIADRFGAAAVKDTYERVIEEWHSDYRYMTELVIVLNQRCWSWWQRNHESELGRLYSDLYYKAKDKFYEIFANNEEACDYFFNMTD